MLNRIHMFKKFKYRISCQDKIRKTKLCYNRKIFIGLLLFHFASFSSVPKKEEEEEEGTEAGKRYLYDVQFVGEDGIA